jgi:hypothetical protein
MSTVNTDPQVPAVGAFPCPVKVDLGVNTAVEV